MFINNKIQENKTIKYKMQTHKIKPRSILNPIFQTIQKLSKKLTPEGERITSLFMIHFL